MSLDDLVIKQHTDPLRREIDRLREVKAKLTEELNAANTALAAATEKVKELTAEETALRALWKNANLAAHELAAELAAKVVELETGLAMAEASDERHDLKLALAAEHAATKLEAEANEARAVLTTIKEPNRG